MTIGKLRNLFDLSFLVYKMGALIFLSEGGEDAMNELCEVSVQSLTHSECSAPELSLFFGERKKGSLGFILGRTRSLKTVQQPKWVIDS